MEEPKMATIILGNGGNLSVSANDSDRDTIILGNGGHDAVSAASSQHDTIILGNGAGDTLNAYPLSFSAPRHPIRYDHSR
jgi:hypothetical protein